MTIWLLHDRLAQAGLGTKLFGQVQQQLQAHDYLARCGQIIDASLVQVSVQHNKREEAVGADLKLTHRADPNLTQGGALRF